MRMEMFLSEDIDIFVTHYIRIANVKELTDASDLDAFVQRSF
jgi:hypothetical protein